MEVLFSLSLMGLALVGILPAFLGHFQNMTTNEVRSSSLAAAQVVLDGLRTQDPSSLPASGSGGVESVNVGTKTYQVEAVYCLNASLCSGDSRHITAIVRYRGNTIYEVETIFTQLR